MDNATSSKLERNNQWLLNAALVATLLAALLPQAQASLSYLAFVVGVLALLKAQALIEPATNGSVTWAMVLRHLFGPVILPVYGLAAAGLLWLDGTKNGAGCSHCGSEGGGCTSCHAEADASHAAKLAPPSMCGGSCGPGGGGSGGCGSGGCGKSGRGCGSGCGGGAKKSTAANPKGVANVNIPPPRAKMNPVPPAAANLPGLNGPNARPLPAGVLPNAAVAMPAGVAPAGASLEPGARGLESAAPAANPSPPLTPTLPLGGASAASGQTPSSMPQAPGPSAKPPPGSPSTSLSPSPSAPSPVPVAAPKGEVIRIPVATAAPTLSPPPVQGSAASAQAPKPAPAPAEPK